jgi:hypothetical protein
VRGKSGVRGFSYYEDSCKRTWDPEHLLHLLLHPVVDEKQKADRLKRVFDRFGEGDGVGVLGDVDDGNGTVRHAGKLRGVKGRKIRSGGVLRLRPLSLWQL